MPAGAGKRSRCRRRNKTSSHSATAFALVLPVSLAGPSWRALQPDYAGWVERRVNWSLPWISGWDRNRVRRDCCRK